MYVYIHMCMYVCMCVYIYIYDNNDNKQIITMMNMIIINMKAERGAEEGNRDNIYNAHMYTLTSCIHIYIYIYTTC